MRLQGTASRSRLQGAGFLATMLKVLKATAPHLLPALGKLAEGAADGLGKKFSKMISGEGTKLAGGNIQGLEVDNRLIGKGVFLPGQKKSKYRQMRLLTPMTA